VKRLQIPGTDLEVSVLGFGTTSLGTAVQDGEADRLVSAFLEAGGCLFDTAHCYAFWEQAGLGASERELGASLRRLCAWSQAVVATKGGHPDGGRAYPRPDAYLSEQVIASDLDDSLRRLGVERVDLYYMHRDDPRVPVDEIVGMLNREVARGRVRYIGVSNWSVARMAAANRYARGAGLQGFVASQLQWSLAEPNWRAGPDPTTRSVSQRAAAWHAAEGMPIVAYSATASGYFAGSPQGQRLYDNPHNRGRRGRAADLAAHLGATPTQVALAYLLHQKPAVVPLFSTTNPTHLEEILGSTSLHLNAAQLDWLWDGTRAQLADR
jgi:aryl-alcohol dehydrogenase-like predicted oxidoreductase